MTTAMARETAEIPDAVDRLLSQEAASVPRAADRDLARADPPFAVICGRGSSGHAGVHLRYLIETHLGIAVSATAPSVVTSYRRPRRCAARCSSSSRSPAAARTSSPPRRPRGDAGAITLASSTRRRRPSRTRPRSYSRHGRAGDWPSRRRSRW